MGIGIYGYMDIYWILQILSEFRRTPIEISSKFRRVCVHFSEISSTFRRNFVQMSGFRVSQQRASVWWLPAALRRPQKKHAPGFWEHVSCGFCRFLLILFKNGRPLPRNVSNSRNCIQKPALGNLHPGPPGPPGPAEVVS